MNKKELGLQSKQNRDSKFNDEVKTSFPNVPKHTNLPHLDIEGYYQFVTFRTYDSIDEYVNRIYDNEDIANSKKQYLIDKYLDNSQNGAYLNGRVLKYLYDFLLSKNNILYEMVSFVIMSNHVHLLIKPLDRLDRVMKLLKGSSSYQINKILNRSGKFWANNYYDRAIRDEKHFFTVYEYIKNNYLKLDSYNEDEFRKRFYGIYE